MPDPLQNLFVVQEKDITIDQLQHRRASLPQRVALAEQQAELVGVDGELAELGGRIAELQRSQKRLEDEIEGISAKGQAENTRMYSGSVTSPRELQAMQEEIDGLARRQRILEDQLLDIMEVVEPLTEQADGLSGRHDELAAAGDRITAELADAEGAVDVELAAVSAERAALAAGVPDELLATYERLRTRLGGVALARIEGAQCTGCHLSLPATELDAIRHAAPDAVLFHEECGRILVH